MTDTTTQTARAAQGDNPTRERIDAPTSATFKTTDGKLYVPVVTLSTENDKIVLKQIRTGRLNGINIGQKWLIRHKKQLKLINRSNIYKSQYIICLIIWKWRR